MISNISRNQKEILVVGWKLVEVSDVEQSHLVCLFLVQIRPQVKSEVNSLKTSMAAVELCYHAV